jgi:hypothetical protein
MVAGGGAGATLFMKFSDKKLALSLLFYGARMKDIEIVSDNENPFIANQWC